MATAKKGTKKAATKAKAAQTKARRTRTSEPLRVCVDRPVTLLNATRRMLHSINHNMENNPALPGSREHELVTQFVKDPHHSFGPDEAAALARMAIITSSKWQPGTTITISFLDGSALQKRKVKKMAARWLPLVNLKFNYLRSRRGMIRISFVNDPGSWSYIGTQCLSMPEDEPTMNFGWLRDDTDDAEWERVVVHEFGHALGCIHEHQNPAGGIKWNKPAVYKYYEGPPNNWTKAEVDNNLFHKYAADQTQFTAVDRNSIMMYPIPKEFLLSGDPMGWNLHLSPTDEAFIAETYPKDRAARGIRAGITTREVAHVAAVAHIKVEFTEGLSRLDAELFHNGGKVDGGSVDKSDTITFGNVQSGDTIALNGVCTGKAVVTIDVPTNPSTPVRFNDEDILFGCDVL